MGKGGGDLCVEVKVWNSLVREGMSSPHETSFHGDTHGFGNTEERAIRDVLGVAEREGDARWDSATGAGAVEAHPGTYHDAIHVKRNTVELRLHNIFGGFNKGAAQALHALSRRPVDRTVYENWAAAQYKPYWGGSASPRLLSWPTQSGASIAWPACALRPATPPPPRARPPMCARAAPKSARVTWADCP